MRQMQVARTAFRLEAQDKACIPIRSPTRAMHQGTARNGKGLEPQDASG